MAGVEEVAGETMRERLEKRRPAVAGSRLREVGDGDGDWVCVGSVWGDEGEE